MKFNSFRLLLSLSVIILLSSCLATTDTTVSSSSNACFSSLTFAANTSFPALSTAAFTLVETNPATKDSMIVNVDSLLYKTRIDSVYATFSFKSTAYAKLHWEKGAALNKFKKDSAYIDGTDTIDFRNPLNVKNWASDGTSGKVYEIVVNVHKVQPELYNWFQLSKDNDAFNAAYQKAIIVNNNMYYYLSNSTEAHVYVTANEKMPPVLTALNGFPVGFSLNDMLLFNGTLFLTQNSDKIYSSINQLDWNENTNTDYNFKSLLYVFNNSLWAVVQSKADKKYRFASSANGVDWTPGVEIPVNFPVKDFSAISFSSRTHVPRVLVCGGKNANDSTLLNRWSSENGNYWVDFSPANKTLDTLAIGATILPYDDKLLLFGKRKNNSNPYLLQSKDEGLSWQRPDSAYNYLHMPIHSISEKTQKDTITSYSDFESHKMISAVLMRPKTYVADNPKSYLSEIQQSNRIYLFGIKSGEPGDVIDIWTGKLNRKNFLRQ